MPHRGLIHVLAAAAVLGAAGCPTPPSENAATAGGGEGGERPPAEARGPLPTSALDPIRDDALERARAELPEGGEVFALIVRADVAFAAADGSLEWHRVGFVLAPFGLRLFEHTPRTIVRPDHGTDAADPTVAPIARALAEATPLSGDECDTLPEDACASLAAVPVEPPSADPAEPSRISLAAVGVLSRAPDGTAAVVDVTSRWTETR